MPIRTIEELKSRFQNADKPDGADFVDLIDTLLNIPDGSVTADKVPDGELPVTKLEPGSPYQLIRTNDDASAVEWFSATSNQIIVTQTLHGFVAGEVVTVDATEVYILAQADTFDTRQAVGIVLSVPDANTFILATSGLVTGLPFTVTPGVWHYLSASAAGDLTTTAPSAGGEYVGAVLFGVSSNSGVLMIQESKSVVTGTGTFDPVYITPELLATGNHTSGFTTIDIDSIVPALAGTPFRFAILQIIARANNNDTPQLQIRKDSGSPTFTIMWLFSDDEDGVEAPDTAAYHQWFPVVTSPKTFDIHNTSSFSSFNLYLVGYIP